MDGMKRAWSLAMPWLMVVLASVFYTYESLLRVAPSVMSTDLMLHYRISAASLGHLAAFYYYIYDPMQLGVGLLMDKYGPRRLLTLASAVCGLGAYLFVATSSLWVAELGRFCIGFGSAFAFVGVLKLATLWLPANRFAIVSGMTMALGMVGGMVGNVGLTALVERQGWVGASLSASWFGLALAVVLFVFLRNRQHGPEHTPMDTPTSFGPLWANTRQVIRNRQMWVNGLIGCLMWLPTSVFAEVWGITYLMEAHQLSSAQAAKANAMIFLGWAIGGPLVGLLSDTLRLRRLPITFGAAMAATLLSIVLFMPNLSYCTLSILLLCFGMASSVQVIVFPISREINPEDSAGTALALTNMFVMISGVLQPLTGVVLDWMAGDNLIPGVHGYPVEAYQTALSILPIGLVVTVVLSFLLRETHGRSMEDA